MEQGGMEVPCTFRFIGKESWIKKLSTLFQSKWCNASTNDEQKGCSVVKLKTIDMAECPPFSHSKDSRHFCHS